MRQSYGENVPCLDTTGADIYLNRADVKSALHISSKVNAKWAICSSTLKYQGIYDDLALTATDTFKEWYYEDPDSGRQVGGWTKDFDKLAFVTVRGSGHMVPQYRPIPALKMFEAFLKHESL